MKTTVGKNTYEKTPDWYIVDATNQVLGRLASQIATVLIGKHKPNFTRHVPMGDAVIVVNADKIKVTGKKLDDKVYKNFSGYPGGLKEASLKRVLVNDPKRPLTQAVQGMLPKSGVGNRVIKRLHVYTGAEHPHRAQNPKELKLTK